ncbi:MAG: V-type ATP synthase subunit E [Candidatus Helarchaeota archaeon]
MIDKKQLQEEIEKLSKKVIESAEEKAEKIIEEAKEKSIKMLEKTKIEILNEVNKIYESTEKKTIKIAQETIIKLYQEFRKELLMKKEEIIQEIFDKLIIKLRELKNSEKYRNFLNKLIIKSINFLGENHIILILEKYDLEHIDLEEIKKGLKDKTVKIEISKETLPDDVIGGFLIKLPKKNVELNNTIKEILTLKREYIRREISRMIFTKEE